MGIYYLYFFPNYFFPSYGHESNRQLSNVIKFAVWRMVFAVGTSVWYILIECGGTPVTMIPDIAGMLLVPVFNVMNACTMCFALGLERVVPEIDDLRKRAWFYQLHVIPQTIEDKHVDLVGTNVLFEPDRGPRALRPRRS